MEWIDAIMECRFINAEFLVIESEDEFLNIIEALKSYTAKNLFFNNSYYIGAEDQLRSKSIFFVFNTIN